MNVKEVERKRFKYNKEFTKKTQRVNDKINKIKRIKRMSKKILKHLITFNKKEVITITDYFLILVLYFIVLQIIKFIDVIL